MRIGRALALALVSIEFCACNKSPTEPGNSVGFQSLTITGPATVAPGQTVRYTATALYSNGVAEDVTEQTSWSSPGFPNGAGVQFTGGGVAVISGRGERTIRASYVSTSTGISRSTDFVVLVLPAGTFKLSGKLTDDTGQAIGARVDVLSGTGAGLFAYGPQYVIYGVAGHVQLEASSENYTARIDDVDVTSNTVHDFVLGFLYAPPDVSGVWTMTFDAPSASCPPGLPSIAYGRSYRVQLTQSGTRLGVSISSPTLTVNRPELLGGFFFGPQVYIDLEGVVDDFTGKSSPNLLDRLSSTEWMEIDGQVKFDPGESPIAATLASPLRYWSGPPQGTPAWSCTADDHKVTMRRQDGATIVRRGVR